MLQNLIYPKLVSTPQVQQPALDSSDPILGPSDTLLRIRDLMIRGSFAFYDPKMEKTINLINEYIGADQSQEEAISKEKTSLSPERLFLSEVQQYKKKKMIRSEDRPYVLDWVKTIVSRHRKYVKLLPSITLEPGDSEGVTYVITKAKKIYGFLYGTMHNFSFDFLEGEILTKLSLETQIRLLSCHIIGTEITVEDEPTVHSVEGALMNIADQCAITNIGIDDATCDRSQVGTIVTIAVDSKGIASQPKKEKPKLKEQDHIEDLSSYLTGATDERTLNRITLIALHTGVLEFAWAASLTRARTFPDSDYQKSLQIQRHQAMAENIHTLLSACEVIGQESEGTPPPRCFFPIGISHLIPTQAVPKSVVELVAEKGWQVERIVKKNTKLAFSREMTKREAQLIGELIVDMRKKPLFHSHKPYLPAE